MFTESLLAAALTFSAWYGDTESSETRESRLHLIAEAIDIATLHAVCDPHAPQFPGLDESESSNDEREAADECVPVWAGSARRLAFLLLTQAYFETRLAAHIHAGHCRVNLGECDGGKATSLWQLHFGPQLSHERWAQLSGTNLRATTWAAYEAAKALSRARNHCRSLAGAVSLYATGKTCNWKPAARRVAFSTRLADRY